ncbi:MAG: energy-coupling factor transporter transmembrane protein EcfT [Armatimonadetes bacterium]|nr:energy-coupling factor transporter transmembrane protein EcfT [Armatimonadota bacterium]
MRFVDPAGRGLISSIHPYVRVYCGGVLLLAAALPDSPRRLVATGVIVALFAAASRIGWRVIVWGAIPVVSLVGGVGILSVISGMRMEEFRLQPVVMFAGKCYLAYLASASLAASTHYADALQAFDLLRVPTLFTSIAGSICRWFHLVFREASAANTARVLRGGDRKNRLAQAGDLARISASVMTWSFARAERVAAAMECRGFRGILVRLPGRPLRARDLIWLVAIFALLVGIWVVLQ